MKAARTRSAVLNAMGRTLRVCQDDNRPLSTVLVQSAASGTFHRPTPCGFYAAEHARQTCDWRCRRGRNKLPTKMTLCHMMLTVPPLLIILVAPSVMNITKTRSVRPRMFKLQSARTRLSFALCMTLIRRTGPWLCSASSTLGRTRTTSLDSPFAPGVNTRKDAEDG